MKTLFIILFFACLIGIDPTKQESKQEEKPKKEQKTKLDSIFDKIDAEMDSIKILIQQK